MQPIKKFVFAFIVLAFALFFLQEVSAAHYITGVVNDAQDGSTSANGKIIVLWNPSNGIGDNLTDIVGPSGNSGADNVYLIDCELLNTPCNVNDVLNLRVLNSGDGYFTNQTFVTVSGYGYDVAGNLTLNSPPNVSLISPLNNSNISSLNIEFNCSAEDLDSNLANITLYGNWSGGWHANETLDVSGGFDSVIFTKNLPEGVYEWGCSVSDDLLISNFSLENYTFRVDRTSPTISSVEMNQSYVCGTTNYVRVNCTVSDDASGIDDVIIEGIYDSGRINYTAQFLSQNTYYADVLINYSDVWWFNCIVNDSAGNTANKTSLENVTSYSTNPDLTTYSENLVLSKSNPVEDELILIKTFVFNNGCSDVNSFDVGFYLGDPNLGGKQIGQNQTLSVQEFSNISANVSWNAKVGKSNIFVVVDMNDSILESNESNNQANKTFDINSWQEFYGNVSINYTLLNSNQEDLKRWEYTGFQGNVFVSDKESEIDWNFLQAITRNITNQSSSNDFSEIDDVLNMSDYNDSVYSVFSNLGTPKNTDSFQVGNKIIENVPIINSTINSDFKTGILWDSSDDISNGEFDSSENEDLVFVVKINRSSQGSYGIYDYEIKIPVNLRDQNKTDSSELYFYYDLV